MSVRSTSDVPALVGTGAWAAIGDLVLESGALLPGVRLFYEAFGNLADDKSNAVLVFHGLAADSHLARDTATDEPGWWSGVVGPGLGLDTERLCVISANILGGCYGSTGPMSMAPDGQDWASRFPPLTIRDQVAAAVRLGETLGITTWAGSWVCHSVACTLSNGMWHNRVGPNAWR